MDGSRSLLSDYVLGRHKARLFFWGGGSGLILEKTWGHLKGPSKSLIRFARLVLDAGCRALQPGGLRSERPKHGPRQTTVRNFLGFLPSLLHDVCFCWVRTVAAKRLEAQEGPSIVPNGSRVTTIGNRPSSDRVVEWFPYKTKRPLSAFDPQCGGGFHQILVAAHFTWNFPQSWWGRRNRSVPRSRMRPQFQGCAQKGASSETTIK